jgi:hypothetical protein
MLYLSNCLKNELGGKNNGGIGYVFIKIWLTEDCTVGHFYIFWSHLKKKIDVPALQRNFLPPKKRLKRYYLQLLK